MKIGFHTDTFNRDFRIFEARLQWAKRFLCWILDVQTLCVSAALREEIP